MDHPRPGALTTIMVLGVSATLGAAARYYMTLWATAQWGDGFPYGTLLINVLGSFILGAFLTLSPETRPLDPTLRLLVATGLCGSFTTFSTFSYETVRLLAGGRFTAATLNVVGSVALGLAGVIAGALLSRTLLD